MDKIRMTSFRSQEKYQGNTILSFWCDSSILTAHIDDKFNSSFLQKRISSHFETNSIDR